MAAFILLCRRALTEDLAGFLRNANGCLPRMRKRSSTDRESRRASSAVVLCAGIAVVDFIFRVERFPTPSTKTPTDEFLITGGGCAANAALAIARLGGAARFAGPLGDDELSTHIVDGLKRAKVDIGAITRIRRAVTSVSGIFIDPTGERLLTTRRGSGLATARPNDPARLVRGVHAVLADNHFPEFVTPICVAARETGLPVVLDVDKPAPLTDPLLALASHAIFSAEALRQATAMDDFARALEQASRFCTGMVAVTDGTNGAFWREGVTLRHQPAFAVEAIDTLAAGDVFHGAFVLALAEGQEHTEALRFASAAAALKCTRFGGIVGTPKRAEVRELLTAARLMLGSSPQISRL